MRMRSAVGTVTVVDQELPLLPLPLAERLSMRQWMTVDVVVAGLIALAAIAGTAAGLDGALRQDIVTQVLRYLLIVTACVALPYRRHHPGVVLAIVTPAVMAIEVVGSRGPMLLVVILAIYTLASLSPPQISLRAAAVVIAGVVGAQLAATGNLSLVVPPVIFIGWLAGENTRTRRAYLAGVTEWAAERDRQREERSRRALADERLRIARELHDVVAHTMSVVAVRSGVARMVLDSQPDEVGRALEIIEVASRRAMHEMRLLVGVLRDGDGAQDLAPAPGLEDLPQLVAEIGAAGVVVQVRIEGVARPLPAGIDVSAFRIVQEALTNVVRHARPAGARLDLRYRPADIEIEVTDDGGGRPRPVVYPAYPTPNNTANGTATATSGTAIATSGTAPSGALTATNGTATNSNGTATAAARTTSAGATIAGPKPAGTASGARPGGGTSDRAGTGRGHGLVGMRERVALFGGTFTSGPHGSGYRVTAILPTDEGAPKP
jgi:signal transduction histidine kinase